MKWWLVVLLILAALVVYSIPTVNDAIVEKRVIKAARSIASDLMFARLKTIQTHQNYGVFFIRDTKTGYKVFVDVDNDGIFNFADKVIKYVDLSSIDKNIKYSRLFDDKGTVFKNNTFVFDGKKEKEGDSIFLIYASDEAKQRPQNSIRIYVDKTNDSIKILRVKEVTQTDDLVFEEI